MLPLGWDEHRSVDRRLVGCLRIRRRRSVDRRGERKVYTGARPTASAVVYALSEPGFRAIAYDDELLWVTDDIDDFGDPIEIDPGTQVIDFVDGPDPRRW